MLSFLSSLGGPRSQTAIKSHFRRERPNNASPLREQINFSFPFPCFPQENPLIEEWEILPKGVSQGHLILRRKKKRKKVSSFNVLIFEKNFLEW